MYDANCINLADIVSCHYLCTRIYLFRLLASFLYYSRCFYSLSHILVACCYFICNSFSKTPVNDFIAVVKYVNNFTIHTTIPPPPPPPLQPLPSPPLILLITLT
jgi:hypothetical protein